MLYLRKFQFASADDEDGFVLSYPYQLEMQCYSHNNVYPFKILPQKQLRILELEPITFLYGGNGSGKSTVLNILAEKLGLARSSPWNQTPFMEEYLKFCRYELDSGVRTVPQESRFITSDDVFDFLLDLRSVTQSIDQKRTELFAEYDCLREDPMQPLRSISDLEDLKRRNEAKSKTKSVYVSRRIPKELCGKSNGESAFAYFTQHIRENALYLLDEPENSLSAELQKQLANFIEESVRFYHCQFIISTHSPFLLAMRQAKIYDLDSCPVTAKPWTALENVRTYYDFFKAHFSEFD